MHNYISYYYYYVEVLLIVEIKVILTLYIYSIYFNICDKPTLQYVFITLAKSSDRVEQWVGSFLGMSHCLVVTLVPTCDTGGALCKLSEGTK